MCKFLYVLIIYLIYISYNQISVCLIFQFEARASFV